MTLLVGRQEGHPACKNRVVGAGVVVCQEQGADLHMAQLMPLLLTVSCFRKIQIGFTFLVSADLGSPGQRAVKRVCMCVCGTDVATSQVSQHSSSQHVLRLQDNHGITTAVNSVILGVCRDFYRAMLCMRDTSHGPVSVRVCVCHKSVFYRNG